MPPIDPSDVDQIWKIFTNFWLNLRMDQVLCL
jgi:hypothetical protein